MLSDNINCELCFFLFLVLFATKPDVDNRLFHLCVWGYKVIEEVEEEEEGCVCVSCSSLEERG